MAYFQLESDNPNFSFLIRKNPASGMLVKRLRQGTVFGFYSKNNPSQYNCWFKDHNSSSSYDPGAVFEYNDTTRYSAALFTNHCCDEFFRDTCLKVLPEDTAGFRNILLINCIRAKSKYIEIFSRSFRDFQWDVTPLTVGYYRVKLSTGEPLRRLLCFACVFSLINAIQNGECDQFDEGLLVKYAKMIQYLDAPYFVRYVFKVNLIRSESTFAKLSQYLNNETIKLQYGHNFLQRMRFVEQHLDSETLIDVGCGEGKYLRYAKKAQQYFAIEREEVPREIIQRKCQRDGRENVTILESLDDLPDIEGRKTFFLTEVVEHNDYDDAIALLKRCLLPNSRVIVTTPNRDFNVHYFGDEEPESDMDAWHYAMQESSEPTTRRESHKRHEDHHFELTQEEFHKFIATATGGVPCRVTFYSVGDKVSGVSPQSGAVIDVA